MPSITASILFIILFLIFIQVTAAAENDWELWNVYSVRLNVTEKWRATLGTEFKFDTT